MQQQVFIPSKPQLISRHLRRRDPVMRVFFAFLVLLQGLFLAALGFLPTDKIPYHENLPQDKILHSSGFLILTFLTFFIWDRPHRLHNVLLTAVPVGVLAFASEILQPVLSPVCVCVCVSCVL